MNQTVKIFFTDMDDTLLNSEKQVTKENMDAISEALAAGHKIVFNTGRPLSGFLPILKELGLDREGCYAIAFNGGLIYDCAAQENAAPPHDSARICTRDLSKKRRRQASTATPTPTPPFSAAMQARKRAFTHRQSTFPSWKIRFCRNTSPRNHAR